MSTDEEYLDSLLKSVTEGGQPEEIEDVLEEMPVENPADDETADTDSLTDVGTDIWEEAGTLEDLMQDVENSELPNDDLTDFFSEPEQVADNFSDIYNDDNFSMDLLQDQETSDGEELSLEQLIDNSESSDLSLEQLLDTSQELDSEEVEEWKADIDSLLAQTEVQEPEDIVISDDSDNEESVQAEESMESAGDFSDMEEADITDLIDNMENSDSDLDEINSLLKKADKNQSVDDDMLALLESIDENAGDNNADDDFDIFSEDMPETQKPETVQVDRKKAKGKKQKGKKAGKKPSNTKLFVKKDDSEDSELETGIQSVLNDEDDDFQDNLLLEGLQDSGPGENRKSADDGGKEEDKKEKTPGFLARFLAYISQEEEEPDTASDENAEILKELSKEDKAKKEEKKKKKAEKKEKGKNAKGKKEAKPKKEKKPKPVKEKKEKEKTPWENPFRILTAKHVIAILAFCATIIASICIFVTFLPQYADKENAREAFYQGNYGKVYELFYNKKLSGNDEIIFDRAKTILILDRKLKSYYNNIALNQELEAVDALIRGVECYWSLEGVDEYGVRAEIDSIYQQICIILENNYGITPDDAIEIYKYDNVTYTQRLTDAINGIGDSLMEEEPEAGEEDVPLDVLPEEEELLTGEGA